jgi:hypothetical protein
MESLAGLGEKSCAYGFSALYVFPVTISIVHQSRWKYPYTPGSRAAAGLSMAALIGFGQMAGVLLTSSTTAVLVGGVWIGGPLVFILKG